GGHDGCRRDQLVQHGLRDRISRLRDRISRLRDRGSRIRVLAVQLWLLRRGLWHFQLVSHARICREPRRDSADRLRVSWPLLWHPRGPGLGWPDAERSAAPGPSEALKLLAGSPLLRLGDGAGRA